MIRNDFVDFAKGLLILLVVIGHALQFVVYQDQGSWDHPFYKAIYLFHMPLFMAISGYLSYSGIQRAKLVPFLTSRLHSYIIPIFFWASLFSIGTTFAKSGDLSPKGIASDIIHEAIGTNFWFLWALLGSLVVTAMVKAIGGPFLLLYALSLVGVMLLPEQGILYLFKFTYPYFQIGYLVSGYGIPRVIQRHQGLSLAVTGILTAIGYALWKHDTYVYITRMSLANGNYQVVAFRFVVCLIAAVFAILLIHRIHKIAPPHWIGLLLPFGRDSIYIYIIQGYLFIVLWNLVIRSHAVIPSSNLVGALISIPIGIAVTWMCWRTGVSLSFSYWSGRLLFGKTKRPQPIAEKTVAIP